MLTAFIVRTFLLLKYDRDDDDSNGTWEEAEIVITGEILAETSYNVDYWWAVPSWVNLVSGTFSLVSQYGPYNPITGEYEAPNYDLLDKWTYNYNFSTMTGAAINNAFLALGLNKTNVEASEADNSNNKKDEVVASKKDDLKGMSYYAVKKPSGKVKVYTVFGKIKM